MTDHGPELPCPACGADSRFLTAWRFSGLNDSVFDYTARYFDCPACGLSYIANVSDERLGAFYQSECCYFESAHFDITAPENVKKYQYYHGILAREGLAATPVTDVGCGRGGFLLWLRDHGWQGECLGIDIDLKSIPELSAGAGGNAATLSFRQGWATALPCPDQSQSLLTYFHVLEHIRDLGAVLGEAQRAIKEGGYLMIEVPDAERYAEFPIGTAFWPGIREHVNHFSPKALCAALARHGFLAVSIDRELLPTPEFSYPSLVVLARKGAAGRGPEPAASGKIASFILESQRGLQTQAAEVAAFSRDFPSFSVWGCSAQLFSLLPLLEGLPFALGDGSAVKQDCRYRGIPIGDPGSLRRDGALIIAPYLHSAAIAKAARELGWPESSIYRLR